MWRLAERNKYVVQRKYLKNMTAIVRVFSGINKSQLKLVSPTKRICRLI
jgi:hypothetical protein